ncbi:MAG: pilus assembly protein PilM [Verrucomicrobiae bacterium]|nr:pilus assembly protein PilM [Verrucomicrobiae bacterium]
MAKTILGIDVGFHSVKGVALSGTGKTCALTRAAIVPQNALADPIQQTTDKALATAIKELLSQLKAAKGECHIAFNSPTAVLRYVESPMYTHADLRDSLRLNHQTYLRQTFENFTFDGLCVGSEPEAAKKQKAEADKAGATRKGKAVIAGLPQFEINLLWNGARGAGLKPTSLTLSPISLMNAFELAYPAEYHESSVLLMDIGHLTTSLTILSKGATFLTRVVALGGRAAWDYLVQSQGGVAQAETARNEGGNALGEAIQASFDPLFREVRSSINFFERNTDTDMRKIYLSGTLVKSPRAVEVLQECLGIPCETWNPAQGMQVNLPPGQLELFSENQAAFGPCIGAARFFCGN